ncbi:NAD(P)-dependent oxidoreductase [Polyangium sp. 6x1]|uniref:phosphoglycerate dehydrogenase n=1 Tax=Polyangium sp. 6x1 TaxID=3042689 RepID=UPI002482D59C|nr:NAD(P)-dependent oxidoreductase [Polyangium sp. 6x1]MDI1443948.1 NAD(P)-dependent oxidoreductase [Polyangium sp. 6x1]
MRLLIADKMDTQALEELRILGVEIISRPELTKETLPAALEGIGILVVRSTEVTARAIEAGRQLNLIVRAGAGVNTIDVAAASARGVYVANCPGKNAIAVAELTMGLVVALDRRIVDATTDLRAGKWEKTRYAQAEGLYGRRIGVAGLGAVGREVLNRARGFGLEPHAWSRSLSQNKAQRLDVGFARSLEELASRSHVLTIHLPLDSRTRGIVGRSVLEALPDGAIVVNTARSEVMDYEALEDVIAKKGLRVGLDVFPNEPDRGTGTIEPRIFGRGIVYGTPHIGASTEQAQRAIAMETARIIRAFMTEETVPNVVNICATSPARYVVVIRMLDKVGVLANTLSVLKRHGINIEEISNTVFDGALATCTKMRVSGRPSDACMKEIAAFDEVLHVDVVSLPNLA